MCRSILSIDRCIGDERDDPHRAAAPGAEQRILQPDHPDEPGSADAPLLDILALICVVGAVIPAVGARLRAFVTGRSREAFE